MITLHCRPAGERPTEVTIGPLAPALATLSRPVFALIDARLQLELPHRWPRLQLSGGEELKTFAMAELVLSAMAEARCDRSVTLLAIGGGSIGDLGGLCACLWQRGVDLWQVPTTLLAMVDSAVGGKTALNLPAGKNLVGTIWPASRVIVDPAFVATLPEREFASGLAEAVKMAIGLAASLFALLEQNVAGVRARQPDLLVQVIERSIAAKIAVVEGDLRETGQRRILNLGHTLGHALEAHAGGALAHGLAVARGLHFALELAASLQAISPVDLARCQRLLAAYGHDRWPLPPSEEWLPFLLRDKKVQDGVLHFALPTGIGRAEPRALAIDLVVAAAARA
ncbi:MAG: 3-dehydroquinate synthase [Planctomycetes bacterium]|nr:3-dehydroquinate synthase [Planctomycetota bacterium]